MAKKHVFTMMVIVIAGLILGWSTWVSNSTVTNRVAIAAIQAEVKSEFKNIEKTLNNHYGLLKEIRDDQKRRGMAKAKVVE